MTSAVARLCSAHLALEKRSADSSAALHRERAQSHAVRQESERLQSRLDEQQRKLIALQSRCAAAEASSAAIREESAALLSSHAAAIGQLRERLRRVETANSQLEQLALDNDIAVPRTIPLLRHSVGGRVAG
jgi:phage shock protein A